MTFMRKTLALTVLLLVSCAAVWTTGRPVRASQIDASGSIEHQATVVFSDAAFRALPLTDGVIVPAPGEHRVTVADITRGSGSAILRVHQGSGPDYTFMSPSPTMRISLNGTGLYADYYLPDIFNWGQDTFAVIGGWNAISGGLPEDWPSVFANHPLTLSLGNNGVAVEGGADTNTVTLTVTFRVFDLVTNRFLTVAESGWDEATRTFGS